MKRIFIPILMATLLCLSSCSWVHNIQLNTLCPAQITYHTPSPNIVVVNNCAIDSSSNESRYIDENGKQYKLQFFSDSLPRLMAMSLGTNLYDSHAFTHVEVLLPDSNHITGLVGIDSLQLSEWQTYAPNDVHIAINAIRPVANMQITPLEDMFCAELTITSQALIQYFIPHKDEASVMVCDTLYWYVYGETPHIAYSSMPDLDECMDAVITSLAVKTSDLFAPHQKIVDRLIFVTGHPAMKDAYKYWERGLYTEASYIWEYVYEHAKDKGRRAKAASNLALYHEIEENLTQALHYAQEAQKIFVDLKKTSDAEYATLYCDELQQRIVEAVALDKALLK